MPPAAPPPDLLQDLNQAQRQAVLHGDGPLLVLAGAGSGSKVECIDFPELGMEAVWKIDVVDFPAFVLVDDKGNDFFQKPGC